MTQETFDTLKAVIQESNLIRDIDTSDWVVDFELGESDNRAPEAQLREYTWNMLSDGANLIDLHWDILNWANDFTHDLYPENEPERLEEEDMLMDAFWNEAAQILIDKPKLKKT